MSYILSKQYLSCRSAEYWRNYDSTCQEDRQKNRVVFVPQVRKAIFTSPKHFCSIHTFIIMKTVKRLVDRVIPDASLSTNSKSGNQYGAKHSFIAGRGRDRDGCLAIGTFLDNTKQIFLDNHTEKKFLGSLKMDVLDLEVDFAKNRCYAKNS